MAKRLVAGIEGGEELKRKLKELGKAARGVRVEAVEAGADVLCGEMRRLAGSDEIETRVSKRSVGLTEVEIGPTKDAYYLQFLETGAQPHREKARIAPAMRFWGDEGLVIVGGVAHPGMRARPFMRPAVDTQAESAKDALGETLSNAIEAVASSGS